MKRLRLLGLMCFSIFVISCATNSNISIQENNNDLPSIIDRAKKSIVYIMSSTIENPETNPALNSACSGVVVESQHIITNYHCVYNMKYLKIFFWDNQDWEEYDLEVVGEDPLADLALLRVPDKKEILPYLKISDETVKEGEDVIAIGHPMGMAWSITKGIISNTDRYARHPFIKALQTDAAINQGNSGGPLLNMKGEVIGINSLLVSKAGQNAGLGISVRGDVVKKSYESMLKIGRIDRPAIGVMISQLGSESQRKTILKQYPKADERFIPNTFGLLVSEDKKIADGVKLWDTIVAINGNLVNNGVDLSDEVIKYEVGDTITLTIIRKKKYIKVDIELQVYEVPVESMYKNRNNPMGAPKS